MSFELEPYQRVKMRNGREGILVANPHTRDVSTITPLLIVLHATGVYSNGYMPGAMTYGKDSPEWDVVEVWAEPNHYGDLLDFARKGIRLWVDESEAVTKARDDMEEAKARLESAMVRYQAALEATK